MKEHCICTLPKVVDEPDVLLLVLDARSYNQLVEEEVCRYKAEDKRHVFVFNIIGA
ncbi:hypothetical protein EDB89DRAFT_2048071 [Lactarius sanguifluus]|nr:hypothetical protein EDB89DRAFT_2048071 [Lactarius sanguifluus]